MCVCVCVCVRVCVCANHNDTYIIHKCVTCEKRKKEVI